MDAMAFGMGMACLQCTFSTQNLDHARYIYDQMNFIRVKLPTGMYVGRYYKLV
jgi:hypothetical protein